MDEELLLANPNALSGKEDGNPCRSLKMNVWEVVVHTILF
jgi:hypothetical protein